MNFNLETINSRKKLDRALHIAGYNTDGNPVSFTKQIKTAFNNFFIDPSLQAAHR